MSEKDAFQITLREVVAYSANLALKEAQAKGLITEEAVTFITSRADEMIMLLLSGHVLTIQDDGTYKSEPQTRATQDGDVLIIGDE